MLEYGVSQKLGTHEREVLYQAVERLGAEMPRGMSAAKFFKDVSAQFNVIDGKAKANGAIFAEYTTCVLTNRGRTTVGVARVGNRDGEFDTPDEKWWKNYPDKWDGQVGQDIALARAVRMYMVDTSRPIRLGEVADDGQVYRTQEAVDLLLVDTVTPLEGHESDNTTTTNPTNIVKTNRMAKGT